MAATRSNWCCCSLRTKCFIIGYINLIVAIVDIVSHFFIVALISRGFECDVDESTMQSVDKTWLVSIFAVINIGTHGFYPFPLGWHRSIVDHMNLSPQPKCYPGMIHLYQLDILNFLINIIWLKFVIAFVRSVHKKDPEPMRMFFGLALVKLVLQSTISINFIFKLADILIASASLFVINQYYKQLRNEKAQVGTDQPPSYVECLVGAGQANKETKTSVATIETNEQKIEVPTDVAAARV